MSKRVHRHQRTSALRVEALEQRMLLVSLTGESKTVAVRAVGAIEGAVVTFTDVTGETVEATFSGSTEVGVLTRMADFDAPFVPSPKPNEPWRRGRPLRK